MSLKTLKKDLVYLEILCYIYQQKTCSSKNILKTFKGRIARRTLYDHLKKWDVEESVIIRDNFDTEKVRFSHHTIKATPKLWNFIQTQIYPSILSIVGEDGEFKDENLRLMHDLENIHKDVSIPQILEVLREANLPDPAGEILKIIVKSLEMILLKKVVLESMQKFKV